MRSTAVGAVNSATTRSLLLAVPAESAPAAAVAAEMLVIGALALMIGEERAVAESSGTRARSPNMMATCEESLETF